MKLIFSAKKATLLIVPLLLVGGIVSLLTATKASAACPGSCDWPAAGRDYFQGYLTNIRANGTNQGAVWPSNSGLLDVHNGTQFVNWMQASLFDTSNGSVNNRAGAAAYVVTSMLGYKGPDFNNNFLNGVNTARSRWNDWRNLVMTYDANGWVSWDAINVLCHPYTQANLDYNTHDVFFFNTSSTNSTGCEAESEIVFSNPQTGSHFRLKKICGNPVGETSPITYDDYQITGRTTVSDATVLPGDTVTFRHYLRNDDDAQSHNTNWTTHNAQNNATLAQGNNEVVAANTEKLVNLETFAIPSNAVPGTEYCRYVAFTPANSSGAGGRGDTVCTRVTEDYSLQPTVTPSATTAQNGDSITFTYTVTNNGITTSPSSVNCKVVGTTHSGGYSPQPQEDEDRSSDGGYSAPGTNCSTPFPPGGTVQVATETITINGVSPGQLICRSLVVNPKDQNGGPRASAESCVVIAKSPYVHFMGNDVWAGGGFIGSACNGQAKIVTTARTLSDGSIAGSTVEYGGFALNRITDFGTASKALLGSGAATGKLLTFSNTDSNNLGFFGAPQHCIDDYLNKFTTTTPEPSTSINVSGRGNGVWSVPNGTNFSGGMPAGVQQVYIVDGNATITGNLTYPANYNGLAEIPSLIIIATGNITVQSAVTQMDGIFVSKGSFRTCDPPAGNLSVSICNNQLVVNGAVIVQRLELLRTAGAEGSSPSDQKKAAEVFYFRPEIYLRSALGGTGTSTIRTVQQQDAPPRY